MKTTHLPLVPRRQLAEPFKLFDPDGIDVFLQLPRRLLVAHAAPLDEVMLHDFVFALFLVFCHVQDSVHLHEVRIEGLFFQL